jgi:hypothetical protein
MHAYVWRSGIVLRRARYRQLGVEKGMLCEGTTTVWGETSQRRLCLALPEV